jgi:hypothetical protein
MFSKMIIVYMYSIDIIEENAIIFLYRVDMAIIGHSGFFRPLQNAFHSIEFCKPVSVPETT